MTRGRLLPGVLVLFVLLVATPAARGSDATSAPSHSATLEQFSFVVEGARLPGFLYLAAGSGPHPTVILLHGLPGNEKNLDMAQALRREGYNVMFFHYRGAWGAEGEYAVTRLREDVLGALTYLRRNAKRYRIDKRALTLIGHSMGGYAALVSAAADQEVACVAALAPANLAVMASGLARNDAAARALLGYADTLYMLKGFSGEALLEQLSSAGADTLDPARFASSLKGRAVLLVVGEQDTVTPAASMTAPIAKAYAATPGLKLQYDLIGGDHAFSSSREELTELVMNWLDQNCRASGT